MRILRNAVSLFLLFTLCASFSLKKRTYNSVYVMGVSLSFKDTVLYVTDIQSIPNVKLTKEGFLPQRDDYSYQLRNYLENQDDSRCHTCITYFSPKKDKLEKKAAALMKRYKQMPGIVIKSLHAPDFQYAKPEDPSEE